MMLNTFSSSLGTLLIIIGPLIMYNLFLNKWKRWNINLFFVYSDLYLSLWLFNLASEYRLKDLCLLFQSPFFSVQDFIVNIFFQLGFIQRYILDWLFNELTFRSNIRISKCKPYFSFWVGKFSGLFQLYKVWSTLLLRHVIHKWRIECIFVKRWQIIWCENRFWICIINWNHRYVQVGELFLVLVIPFFHC